MSTKIGKDKKVLVLDLDGTLTNSQKEITDRTLDAIMKMQEQGHKIVIATADLRRGRNLLRRNLNLISLVVLLQRLTAVRLLTVVRVRLFISRHFRRI